MCMFVSKCIGVFISSLCVHVYCLCVVYVQLLFVRVCCACACNILLFGVSLSHLQLCKEYCGHQLRNCMTCVPSDVLASANVHVHHFSCVCVHAVEFEHLCGLCRCRFRAVDKTFSLGVLERVMYLMRA